MKEGLSYVNVTKFKYRSYCRESDLDIVCLWILLISLNDNSINLDEFTFVAKLKRFVKI